MTIYAGDHGGCFVCGSLGGELAERGHRKGCRSPYANEPPRPSVERAQRRRDEARGLRERAEKLEAEAGVLESGGAVESDEAVRS